LKVLWFTNTPALGEEFIKKIPVGSGWIKSLEREVQGKVELHIAFYTNGTMDSFKYGESTYYPISRGINNILQKYKYISVDNSIENKKDIEKYLRIIRVVKPDLIHIHGTENPFGLIIPFLKTPVIISIQGNITVCAKKYFSGIEKEYSRSFFSIKDFLLRSTYYRNYRRFLIMSGREKQIFSYTKFIIGRTDWDRRITSVLTHNAKYLHSDEVLRQSFYDNKWEKHDLISPIKLITTNGTSFYKGIETILETAKILDKIGFDFVWKIAGISEKDNIVKIIKKKLHCSRVSSNIVFMGSLNEEKLCHELLSSNIYVMPSHIENSANSLCEAMILGMPIIATYAGGTSSLLDNREEGILIQDGDPWSMAGAINELKKDYNKAIVYGKNARFRALERHNVDKIVNGLISIYKDIIKNG
jgi:glycosyltransferase involved in cell wall biosynthesis